MRNLVQFFIRYSFFFLFLLFEVVSFYIIVKNNSFHNSIFYTATNNLVGSIYSKYSSITDYINLKEVNEKLAIENESLQKFQFKNYEKLFGENILVRDTIYHKKYLYTKAKIINNSTNKQQNFITLSIGELNGIKKGMGVIGPSGVIGVVNSTSKHYSTVLAVLNINSKTSAKLKNSNYFGSLQWDGKNYKEGILADIPNHVELRNGDTIVTSGFSSIFPAGIDIATIKDFEKLEGEFFYDIRVNFLVDYKNISWVYVVKNIFKEEQIELEKQNLQEDDQ